MLQLNSSNQRKKRTSERKGHTLLTLGTSSCKALILSAILSLRNCAKYFGTNRYFVISMRKKKKIKESTNENLTYGSCAKINQVFILPLIMT